jgi:hypothetical protein
MGGGILTAVWWLVSHLAGYICREAITFYQQDMTILSSTIRSTFYLIVHWVHDPGQFPDPATFNCHVIISTAAGEGRDERIG